METRTETQWVSQASLVQFIKDSIRYTEKTREQIRNLYGSLDSLYTATPEVIEEAVTMWTKLCVIHERTDNSFRVVDLEDYLVYRDA